MNRDYDGGPIDMSWNDPPWTDGGETVDGTTGEDDGTVTTENVPYTETGPLFEEEWEPTEEQVAQARRLLLNDVLSQRKMAEKIGVNHKRISDYIRGKETVDPDNPPAIVGDQSGEYQIKERGKPAVESCGEGAGLSEAEIKQARRELLEGDATQKEIADRFGVVRSVLSDHIRGKRGADPDTPPAIMWSRQEQEYKPVSEIGGETSDAEEAVESVREMFDDAEEGWKFTDKKPEDTDSATPGEVFDNKPTRTPARRSPRRVFAVGAVLGAAAHAVWRWLRR